MGKPLRGERVCGYREVYVEDVLVASSDGGAECTDEVRVAERTADFQVWRRVSRAFLGR